MAAAARFTSECGGVPALAEFPGPSIREVSASKLGRSEAADILALCSEAYQENFAGYLGMLADPVHVLARLDGGLVSHACWVTRWLQPGDGSLLRTAYVEAVATSPAHQGRGFATEVLRFLANAVADFDIAALSPSDPGFYARIGWEPWRGPLHVREANAAVPAEADEMCMIMRLPRTPALDFDGPLSIEWRLGEVW